MSETYFFRHPLQWEDIRERVLPSLRSAPRPFRFWSAGCSSGAEPYSLSILCQEAGLRPEQDYLILATDISEKALRKCQAAVYSDWDLRGMEPRDRKRWFNKHEQGWALRARYAEAVTFARQDLREAENPGPFDLILCRNVLIYYDRATAAEVVKDLRRRLSARGHLILGYTEACMIEQAPRPREHEPETVALPPLRPRPRRKLAPLPPLPPPPPPEDLLSLADRGMLLQARQYAESLLAQQPANAVAHLHHALVMMQLEGWPQAREALRKALYLEKDLAAGYYYQGLLRRRLGQLRLARKSFSTARQLAGRTDPAAPVRAWEEVNGEQLVRLAEFQLEQLGS